MCLPAAWTTPGTRVPAAVFEDIPALQTFGRTYSQLFPISFYRQRYMLEMQVNLFFLDAKFLG